MSCYLFRFLDDDGNPTGYTGMASSRTKKELFDVIDEFGDPYQTQIKRLEKGGTCWKVFMDNEGSIVEVCGLELGTGFAIFDHEWKNPNFEEVMCRV